MESITMGDHHPSNSTEEADDLQDVVPQPGSGRLYECIFCKRGFTTAQALGGHMNIHRKDRAKGSRPNNPNYDMSNRKLEEDQSCYSNPNRFYDPIFASHSSNYISAAARSYDQEAGLVGFRTCFSSTSRSMRPINNHESDHGVITNPSSLRLQFAWSHEDQNQKRTINGGRNEEDELDLELRLGHDP